MTQMIQVGESMMQVMMFHKYGFGAVDGAAASLAENWTNVDEELNLSFALFPSFTIPTSTNTWSE